jgi:hypothetical protein
MGRRIREPLPAEVDEVRAKVERWRQQRKCLGPMPEKLWAEAAELASRFGMNPICHHMGLSYAALKTRMDKRLSLKPSVPKQNPAPQPKPKPQPMAPTFVELGGDSLLVGLQAGPVLEVSTPDGVRVVLRLPAGSSVDLASLMTAFLGCRG